MKTWIIVVLGMFGMAVLFVSGVILAIIGMNNTAVQLENGIKAQYTQNQNNRSKMVNMIAEAAQVPDMYKNDFKEVLKAAVEGTYGKDGSKAVFQFIQERQIAFDLSLYTKIQTMIESSRAEFSLEQEKLIDKKRVYETKLQVFPGNIVLGMLGFPKIKLDDYKIIVSEDNAKVFEAGKEAPMKLR